MKFSCFPSIIPTTGKWTPAILASDGRLHGSIIQKDPEREEPSPAARNSAAARRANGSALVAPAARASQAPDFPKCKAKRVGIRDQVRKTSDVEIAFYRKDQREEDLIRGAIMANDFLNNLEPNQIDLVVGAMYHQHHSDNSFIITEGEPGNHLYVSGEGEFEVQKRGQLLGTFGPGRVFGELAILYNSPRNASIRAMMDAMVWVLEREVFKKIMMVSSIQRSQDSVKYLRSVPLLEKLSEQNLAEMANLLKVKFYAPGTMIVEEGTQGDEFYIISGGSVKITKRKPGSTDEEDHGTLVRGDYFGEQALLHQVLRQATITALSPGVECLVLGREPFEKLLGGIEGLREKIYPTVVSHQAKEVYQEINLKELQRVGTLGVGGFGRVELVQYKRNKKLTFALKCLKKHFVVDQQQEQHAYNEKAVMLECAECPFITRLYRTYKDSKYVYFLMEPCLGGDVFTVLQKYRRFPEEAVRFMTGCVVEAIDFLHSKGFIYRDLKPENLLLDAHGYLKMIDFGFAKRIGTSGKTWTFAGTPEYVAPEIILGKGHDRAVDYWALGVLVYELLYGGPPFRGNDHLKTYSLIIKGIDVVKFPHEISRDAKSLIRKLCRLVPTERLGYQRNGITDIRQHKWFDGFDWDALRQRSLPAPIVQPVKSNTDLSNFDKYDKEKETPPDETSGWDKDF
ncbi:cGMP-dependent protein kinase, isozyme 1-like isoform X2 [Bacillus rossius redtenbacheri]|uniref:cGMP-dependent protein kinase, isozyme 1-like isoform X2 n=1 Tax=Bacillus rossius redtenbacheri TaxID=93214 RepID=UPI002FDCD0E0